KHFLSFSVSPGRYLLAVHLLRCASLCQNNGLSSPDPSQRILTAPCSSRHTRLPSRDRKSTRLNSSHVSSSYAVFCLKKEKIRPHQAALERAEAALLGEDSLWSAAAFYAGNELRHIDDGGA